MAALSASRLVCLAIESMSSVARMMVCTSSETTCSRSPCVAACCSPRCCPALSARMACWICCTAAALSCCCIGNSAACTCSLWWPIRSCCCCQCRCWLSARAAHWASSASSSCRCCSLNVSSCAASGAAQAGVTGGLGRGCISARQWVAVASAGNRPRFRHRPQNRQIHSGSPPQAPSPTSTQGSSCRAMAAGLKALGGISCRSEKRG